MRRGGAALALLIAGCGGSQRREAERPRAIDEDLVGLLPSGAEAVLDVDVAQLRAWAMTARLRAALPEGTRARIDGLGFDPIADLDLAAAAVTGAGSDGIEVTWLLRGRTDIARVRTALARAEEPLLEVEYHGIRMWEGDGRACASITARTVAVGSRTEVRRVIDVALGNEAGLQGDGLAALLPRAPAAKSGRPAVIAALHPPAPLRERLAAAGVAIDLIHWVVVAIAVGDGIDIGLVAGARDAAGANDLTARMRLRLDDLKAQPLVRLLGLAPFLDVIRLATKRDELHGALRLDQARLDRLLVRLERLFELASGAAK
ncbi:MAG: hypothetical protein EXR72_17320 [Myxococcales bacterium]|nr:hypothetical protein [Myxococcales bacterium]